MKPIQLEISAFGPYSKVVKIDFTSLYEDGLFLITGATGSGKTTIFDAIIFALYGEASGSFRDAKSLRCDFADNSQETYVDLTFQFKRQTYHIRRSPQYMKAGRKTPISAHAELTLPDGKIISTTRDVNQAISKLLGVDVLQFKQIAMIAQGEFTRLIYASSDEKEKIFRKLFGTYHYDQFENLLKEKYLSYKQKIEATMIGIEAIKKQIGEDTELSTEAFIQKTKDESKKVKKQLETKHNTWNELTKTLEEKRQNYLFMKKNNERLDELEKAHQIELNLNNKKDEMNKLQIELNNAKLANEVSVIEKEWQDNLKQIRFIIGQEEKLQKEITLLKEKTIKVDEAYDKLPLLKQKEQNLHLGLKSKEEQLLKLKQYKDIKSQYVRLEKELNKLNTTLKEIEKQIEDHHQKEEALNQFISTHKEIEIDIYSHKQALKEVDVQLNHLQSLDVLVEKEKMVQNDFQKQSTLYQKETDQYTRLNQEVLQYENRFMLEQAGILSHNLKDNEPCPVCGSLHHPKPAQLSDSQLSSETLKTMKKDLEAAQRHKQEVYEVLLQKKQECENIKQRIQIEIGALNIMLDEKENHKQTCITQQNELKNIIDSLEKKKAEVKEKASLLESLVVKTKVLLLNQQKTNENIQSLQSQLATYDGQMKGLEVGETNEDLLLKSIHDIKLDIEKIDNQIMKISDVYQKLHTSLNTLLGKVSSYQSEKEKWDKQTKESHRAYINMVKVKFNDEDHYQTSKRTLVKVNEMEATYQNYLLSKERNETLITSLQKELTHYKKVDLSLLDEEILRLNEESKTLQNDYQYQLGLYEQTQRLLKQLEKDYASIQLIEPDYQNYYDLYSLTSGNNALKLSFERYILSAYFEQILNLANIRFQEMTQQRYKMLRKEEKGSRQSGLDIVIQDYESGTIRDIKTLSGGETFKAALSLALGLSDMIQSNAGGIELDTLFIDEGFGSLDSDSLQQALQVLLQLRQSDKLIGIISHVQELKEQIDRQLVIKKENMDSYIEMV